MRKPVAILAVAVLLAGAGEAAAAPIPQRLPHLVSETKAAYTPRVVNGGFADDKLTHVWSYAPVGSTMYACGRFAQVTWGGQTYDRSGLFAFNISTGQVSPWQARVAGWVSDCAARDGWLYVAGAFTSVGGVAAANLARVNLTTGQTEPFGSTNGLVSHLAWVGDRLLVAGDFTTIDGQPQGYMASLDAAGGFDPWWDVTISHPIPNGGLRVFRFAVGPDGRQGVAIGSFEDVNGQANTRIFRFELRAAGPVVLPWDNPLWHADCRLNAAGLPAVPAWIKDVQFAPTGKYFVVVGTGATVDGFCDSATRWETAGRGDVTPTWINHTCTDTLHSVAVTGPAVYVQGHQKCVMGRFGHEVARQGIAALNPRTGFALQWRSDQSRDIGGYYLQAIPAGQPGAGLWSGCDCYTEGSVIYRPLDGLTP